MDNDKFQKPSSCVVFNWPEFHSPPKCNLYVYNILYFIQTKPKFTPWLVGSKIPYQLRLSCHLFYKVKSHQLCWKPRTLFHLNTGIILFCIFGIQYSARYMDRHKNDDDGVDDDDQICLGLWLREGNQGQTFPLNWDPSLPAGCRIHAELPNHHHHHQWSSLSSSFPIIIIENATKKVTARPRMIDTWMDGSRMINEGFSWQNLAEACALICHLHCGFFCQVKLLSLPHKA